MEARIEVAMRKQVRRGSFDINNFPCFAPSSPDPSCDINSLFASSSPASSCDINNFFGSSSPPPSFKINDVSFDSPLGSFDITDASIFGFF